MDSTKYTIDKVQNIEIDPRKYNNEYNALIQLKTGLIILYNNTKPFELEIIQKNGEQKISYFGVPGNNDLIPHNLSIALPNYFHWFGNSLVNYARLSGFIVGKEIGYITEDDLQYEPERRKIKIYCDNYIKSIPEISQLVKWRHKVSAHFALTAPQSDDNIATMHSSITFPICFENDRFRTAGSMVYTMSSPDITVDSEIPDWSLTEIFEKLIERFWPDVTFN